MPGTSGRKCESELTWEGLNGLLSRTWPLFCKKLGRTPPDVAPPPGGGAGGAGGPADAAPLAIRNGAGEDDDDQGLMATIEELRVGCLELRVWLRTAQDHGGVAVKKLGDATTHLDALEAMKEQLPDEYSL